MWRPPPPRMRPEPCADWHLLDNGAQLARRGLTPAGTLLCVHGNPTWSYLWRDPAGQPVPTTAHPWRVVAVDQLDMGFSERTGTFRRLADRVNDLGDLTAALGLDGPVVTVGHDWGGVISLGWAVAHPRAARRRGADQHRRPPARRHAHPGQPCGLPLHPAVHRWGTTTSDAFLRVTHCPGPPAAGRGCPRAPSWPPTAARSRRARRGELRRGHSRRPVPSQLPGARAASPKGVRGARRSGPDAVGSAGPDLFRPVPASDLISRLPRRASAPLRGCRPPGCAKTGTSPPPSSSGLPSAAGTADPDFAGGPLTTAPTLQAGAEPGARHRVAAPLGAAHRAGGRTRRWGHRRRGNGPGRQHRPLAQLAGAGAEYRRPRGGPEGSRRRAPAAG